MPIFTIENSFPVDFHQNRNAILPVYLNTHSCGYLSGSMTIKMPYWLIILTVALFIILVSIVNWTLPLFFFLLMMRKRECSIRSSEIKWPCTKNKAAKKFFLNYQLWMISKEKTRIEVGSKKNSDSDLEMQSPEKLHLKEGRTKTNQQKTNCCERKKKKKIILQKIFTFLLF